jgi:hypothetical protein
MFAAKPPAGLAIASSWHMQESGMEWLREWQLELQDVPEGLRCAATRAVLWHPLETQAVFVVSLEAGAISG